MNNHSIMPRSAKANDRIRADRRASLLAAATRLFAERGLSRTRMQDVAEEAGVSAGLLYRYFRSREDLVREALRPALERPLGRFVDDSANNTTIAELSENLLADVAERPQLYRLFFASFLQPEVEREVAALREELRPAQEALEARMREELRDRGEADPEAAARELRAALNGLALAIARGEAIDPRSAVARLLGPAAPREADAMPRTLELEIGPPSASDGPAVAALWEELAVPDAPPAPAQVTAAAGYRVLRQGGRVLGYARWEREEERARVAELVVAPAARRKGHARALLGAVAREAAAAGATRWGLYVKADNEAALRLYRGLGMQEQAREIAIELPDAALPLLPRSRGDVEEAQGLAALGEEATGFRDRLKPREGERVRMVRNAYGGVDAMGVGGDRLRGVGARTRGALATLLRETRPAVVLAAETSREARWLLEGGGRERFRLVRLEGDLRAFR